MGLNEGDDFVSAVTLGSREVEQFVDSDHDRATLRCPHDPNASPPGEVEQALVTKYVQRANDGVLIYVEDRCEVDGRRKSLAFDRFTVGDCPTDLGGHLIVERHRFAFVDFDRFHSTIRNSIIQSADEIGDVMTMTPVRRADHVGSSDPAELLIKEARLEARRRRLRYAVAVFIVLVAALSIWLGTGGVVHRTPPSRVVTSSPKGGAPSGSSNGSAPVVLDGQSVNRVVAFGPDTLWVYTANEIALSGGGQGIELTTNAGRTWRNVTPPGLSVDGGDRWMGNFNALSSTTAWVVSGRIESGPQVIETTQNAGRTWSKVGVLPTPPAGCELQFVNVHDGTCTELGGALGSMLITIFRTSDSGASWHKVYANTPNTNTAAKGAIPFGCDKEVDFTSAQKGFTLFFCNGGSGADVEESQNGGSSWFERPVVQPKSVPEGGGGFSGPPVFEGLNGAVPYGVGRDSEIYVTENGGQSFHPVYPPGKPRQWTEDIVSPFVWRLTYAKTVLGTDDGGKSWFTLTSNTVLQTNEYTKGAPPGGIVQFGSTSDGWLTENQYDTNSMLLRTTDGGRQWHKVVVPGVETLR